MSTQRFKIIKRTATTMYGETKIIDQYGMFLSWLEAMSEAMELEAADRGKLHDGRVIYYDVVAA